MAEYKYRLITTSVFDRNYKKLIKRNYNVKMLEDVVEFLLQGKTLPAEYKDHALKGDWDGFRECHIQSDWLLVYKILDDSLVLMLSRTGTHSDLGF